MGVAIHLVFSLKSNSPYTGIHIICKTLEMGFCAFLSVYSTIDFCKTLNDLLDKKPKLAPGGYCVCKTRLHLLYNYFPYFPMSLVPRRRILYLRSGSGVSVWEVPP